MVYLPKAGSAKTMIYSMLKGWCYRMNIRLEVRETVIKEAKERLEKRYICHEYEQTDDIDMIEDYIEEA